jgi:hypothetical protein
VKRLDDSEQTDLKETMRKYNTKYGDQNLNGFPYRYSLWIGQIIMGKYDFVHTEISDEKMIDPAKRMTERLEYTIYFSDQYKSQ